MRRYARSRRKVRSCSDTISSGSSCGWRAKGVARKNSGVPQRFSAVRAERRKIVVNIQVETECFPVAGSARSSSWGIRAKAPGQVDRSHECTVFRTRTRRSSRVARPAEPYCHQREIAADRGDRPASTSKKDRDRSRSICAYNADGRTGWCHSERCVHVSCLNAQGHEAEPSGRLGSVSQRGPHDLPVVVLAHAMRRNLPWPGCSSPAPSVSIHGSKEFTFVGNGSGCTTRP